MVNDNLNIPTQEEQDDITYGTNVRLIKEERETILVFSEFDNCWYADTTVQKHIRKFENQGWECTKKQYYPDGTLMACEFKGNAKAISIRDINPNKPKRIMSEEHKQKLQQKLQEARLKSKE